MSSGAVSGEFVLSGDAVVICIVSGVFGFSPECRVKNGEISRFSGFFIIILFCKVVIYDYFSRKCYFFAKCVECALLVVPKGPLGDSESLGGFSSGEVLQPDEFDDFALAGGEGGEGEGEFGREVLGCVVRGVVDVGGGGVGVGFLEADGGELQALAVVGDGEAVGHTQEKGARVARFVSVLPENQEGVLAEVGRGLGGDAAPEQEAEHVFLVVEDETLEPLPGGEVGFGGESVPVQVKILMPASSRRWDSAHAIALLCI